MQAALAQTSWKIREVDPTDHIAMTAIGRLRCDVWRKEGNFNAAAFPDNVWLDADDFDVKRVRHFIVEQAAVTCDQANNMARKTMTTIDLSQSTTEPVITTMAAPHRIVEPAHTLIIAACRLVLHVTANTTDRDVAIFLAHG